MVLLFEMDSQRIDDVPTVAQEIAVAIGLRDDSFDPADIGDRGRGSVVARCFRNRNDVNKSVGGAQFKMRRMFANRFCQWSEPITQGTPRLAKLADVTSALRGSNRQRRAVAKARVCDVPAVVEPVTQAR